jgi:hypothetical protein
LSERLLKCKAQRDTLWFDITVNGLTGPITGSHIHLGRSGVSGPIIYDLTPFISGTKIKGYLKGIVLGNGDLAKFLEGDYYVNVHTASNPARSMVTFNYTLLQNGNVRIRIFNLLGEVVSNKILSNQSAGEH